MSENSQIELRSNDQENNHILNNSVTINSYSNEDDNIVTNNSDISYSKNNNSSNGNRNTNKNSSENGLGRMEMENWIEMLFQKKKLDEDQVTSQLTWPRDKAWM